LAIPSLVILVNTFKEDTTMNKWNRLLASLDQTLGFTHRQSSKVTKRGQAFDNKTQEHVVWLEYRARTKYTEPPTPTPEEIEANKIRRLTLLQQLLADIAEQNANRGS
jgi:hypothetical protein